MTAGQAVPEADDAEAPPSKALPSARLVDTPCGPLQLRQITEKDVLSVSRLQAESFHEPVPLGFLDSFAYKFFAAEVLDALRQKMKDLNREGYTVLVAEPVESGPAGGPVMGVVEVSVQEDVDVLSRLPVSIPRYGYISSMAVRPSIRRKGVAQTLMEAAELQAAEWEQEHLALHVHEDNVAAVRLYQQCGFQEVWREPGWKVLTSGHVKLLMYKRVTNRDNGTLAAS